MCSDDVCLVSLLLVVLLGFTGLVIWLIKSRRQFLAQNLAISPDYVWGTVAGRAAKLKLSKSDLLFGIWQDGSPTVVTLVIKDASNEVVGTIEYQLGSRRRQVRVGEMRYEVNFPQTWQQTAYLLDSASGNQLATYLKLNMFGKHQVEVPSVGTLISERPLMTTQTIYEYRLGQELVGMSQTIPSTRQIGRVALLPARLPLHIRIFMMSL